MKIHKEGLLVIPWILAGGILFNGIVYFLSGNGFFFYLALAVTSFFFIFNFWFFRDPQTVKGVEPDQVLSVADGKVVVIEPVLEQEYFKEERIQVSVFMSLFNVHINHVPIAGEIVYQKHHPGRFLPAYLAKSSGNNERCTSVIRTPSGTEILVRQIAGILARRIVTYKKPGDVVKPADELGFIRYGSRIDLFFPKDAAILVEMGQEVKGGRTMVAKL
ncbi:MAG: phosphatidylserine decarboxylase family protein [Prolixibacteraceae bacterium]|jgi:phosphatidylserine decarboxylase|nr:phosphatidylserine decarboxylase family protein [Prolixibacteraceae bacterium]MDI9564659.1 phosphatidylserine decarboxylase family protein [Bacteroidota bacterium]NLT00080.1 phosphatidylserine decarboxylase family protein [Bacteroidales bacterium]OQB81928.1 MAG: phosphatidylserine decarboxylase [Bacteroidetes bacterium ADurb.Bin123]HNU76875.1 phosphatidylserine decarboxylase family protein [Prolixibacteraceae bacterium]